MTPTVTDTVLASIEAAMVTVSSDAGKARGFVVEARRRVPPMPPLELLPFVTNRLVITATHCLPFLPPAHPFSYPHERTYSALLGPLDAEPTAAAECLFVDPIADLAVLGAPDGQADYDDDAYDVLIEGCTAVPVGTITTTAPCPAWLLTLTGRWECCSVRVNDYGAGNTLVLVGATEGNRPGTSGSPIITADGCAVGVVSAGSSINGVFEAEQYRQPRLASCLPAWLISEFGERARA